jgi:hypothetical protein
MGSVTITHLIGTVALMAIFLSVGSYYTMSISALRSQVIAVQLGGIANYIGSDLVDLVSLCCISETDQLVIKSLNFPEGITAYGYEATLENTAQGIRVQANLISESEVYGEYILPWSADSHIRIYNGSDVEIENYIQSERPNLNPEVMVFNGETGTVVVWCVKIEDQITIGLGLLSS